MSGNHHADPRKIRAGLSHPVGDADGHGLEYTPVRGTVVEKAAAEVLAGASAAR